MRHALLTALAGLLALSGCIDGQGPDPGGPAPGPDQDPPDAGAPPTPVEPDTTPSDLPDTTRFTFEGADCDRDYFQFQVPADRMEPHMPPGAGSAATRTVHFHLFSCGSGTLDGLFVEGVRLLIFETNMPANENETLSSYLLEAATDWPPLLERLNATGASTHLATFTATGGETSRAHRVVSDTFDYTLDVPVHRSQESGLADQDLRMYAGPDAEALLRFATENFQGDNFFVSAGILELEGGVGGSVTDGPTPAKFGYSQSTVRLIRIQ